MSAACGLALGFYSGALHELGGDQHVSAMSTYFALLPLAMPSTMLFQPLRESLVRLLVLMASLELAVQVANSLVRRAYLRWWDDFTGLNAGWFLAGCLLVPAMTALGQGRLVHMTGCRRAPPPGDEAAPRRA